MKKNNKIKYTKIYYTIISMWKWDFFLVWDSALNKSDTSMYMMVYGFWCVIIKTTNWDHLNISISIMAKKLNSMETKIYELHIYLYILGNKNKIIHSYQNNKRRFIYFHPPPDICKIQKKISKRNRRDWLNRRTDTLLLSSSAARYVKLVHWKHAHGVRSITIYMKCVRVLCIANSWN